MRYPIWKTKDGKRIPINKMSDKHLCNALRMMKYYSQFELSESIAMCASAGASLSGEMATYYAEQELDRLIESDWSELTPPIFEAMEQLVAKRGLKWE